MPPKCPRNYCVGDVLFFFKLFCLLFVFLLRFYGPVNPMGHVERGQFTLPHVYWAGLVL